MTRYVLAGLAMTVGVILLFMSSFGNRPAPVSAPVVVERPPAPAPAPEASPTALTALQEQIRKAAQTMAALEHEVTETRQDLATLQSQKQQAERTEAKPTPPPALPAPKPGSAANAEPAKPGSAADTGPTKPGSEAPAGTRARIAAADTGPTKPGSEAKAEQSAANGSAAAPASVAAAPASPAAPPSAPPPAPAAAPVQPRPAEERPKAAQPAGVPPRARLAEARPAEQHVARGPVPEQRPADDDAYSATQETLNRLRRNNSPPPADLPRPETGPAPANEPHRVPTIDRLADARAAVMDGRVQDARRFLQAAQVQLVFRPISPGEDAPRANQASGPVGQALTALGYGDLGRALVAIEQAMGALGPAGRAQQFGSLPHGDSAAPPISARSWP